MSDAWEEIQAIKSKRNSLREKLQKRKKERQDILNLSGGSSDNNASPLNKILQSEGGGSGVPSPVTAKIVDDVEDSNSQPGVEPMRPDPSVEAQLLSVLCELSLTLPMTSTALCATVAKRMDNRPVSHDVLTNLLLKFATQQIISVKEGFKDGKSVLEVVSAEHAKLLAMVNEINPDPSRSKETEPAIKASNKKRKEKDPTDGDVPAKTAKLTTTVEKDEKKSRDKKATDIMSLLSMPSIKEKENKKLGEEILALLSQPTAKERSLAERFRSQGGAQVMEFCPHGTRAECAKMGQETCKKLHFKKIIQKHTDETLGDCSFLNTCFHMDTCKYVHYKVDGPTVPLPKDSGSGDSEEKKIMKKISQETTILYPPQWVQCDLRYLDMTVLGKFAVIMADPPWDIHMELPYGTMSDDEMRQLGIPTLQDDGLIFLWVTGRAMELGRECLKLWGYERVDEIIWVKTNQLQRIIRTGRTGHWLNHGKEHCLVGMKGSPANLNRGLDCDVIVAEVRATSHKPDEIYGIIERLSPGTRKIELFGRPHNVQPNWITLGNQVDGVRLVDPELIEAFRKRYPDGNCMTPPKT
ncbi:LOW QUALITY PROTEIN: N6-adenosine-methyltransferase catalytic subunit [Homalodisca vitripennis]|uniref:LOW QUALITY PROTEIN: N6-adenosine-methyltransferase catalytic subunit n=1 Tax=Homalodisca vitripennis TaxID=197043 RepID=UPI001EEA1DBE|nr:LOW QUALITY PROTEIN: N6-adenosine-methyltransferase catalytic subunit [Homalodisca vitripennis]